MFMIKKLVAIRVPLATLFKYGFCLYTFSAVYHFMNTMFQRYYHTYLGPGIHFNRALTNGIALDAVCIHSLNMEENLIRYTNKMYID